MRVLPYVLISICSLSTTNASAETCDSKLRERLEREADRMRLWQWSWAAGFGVAAIGQGVGAFFVVDKQRQEVFAVSAIKAGAGSFARLVLAPRIEITADTCASIRENGRKERNAFWLNHVGGFALNAAGAVWLSYRTTLGYGLLSFAIGFPVGIASTYTMPRWAWRAARDLDAGLVVTPVEGGAVTSIVGRF